VGQRIGGGEGSERQGGGDGGFQAAGVAQGSNQAVMRFNSVTSAFRIRAEAEARKSGARWLDDIYKKRRDGQAFDRYPASSYLLDCKPGNRAYILTGQWDEHGIQV
jgi:hypothetical protein